MIGLLAAPCACRAGLRNRPTYFLIMVSIGTREVILVHRFGCAVGVLVSEGG